MVNRADYKSRGRRHLAQVGKQSIAVTSPDLDSENHARRSCERKSCRLPRLEEVCHQVLRFRDLPEHRRLLPFEDGGGSVCLCLAFYLLRAQCHVLSACARPRFDEDVAVVTKVDQCSPPPLPSVNPFEPRGSVTVDSIARNRVLSTDYLRSRLERIRTSWPNRYAERQRIFWQTSAP